MKIDMNLNIEKNKPRKKFLLVAIFFCVSGLIAQNQIHVFSTEIPWSSEVVSQESNKIYRINDAISQASSGDEIIVHEGVYREKIVLIKNNLSISNFENDYVLVSGAERISGNWTDAQGMTTGVKMIDVSGYNIETDYSQLFTNGKIQKLGRHPNRNIDSMMEVIYSNNDGGYSPLINGSKPEGNNATGKITFDETTIPDVDLTGGIIRAMTGKMRRYVYGDIVSKSGNTVSFKAINNNTDWKASAAIASSRFKFSWGFVLHKNLVDTPNEWFIDSNKLYYFPPAGANVSELAIDIQVRERVLVLNNRSNINLTGIHFTAGNVDFQNANNITIDKCSFRYLHPFWTPKGYGQGDTDKKGIYLKNSSNNTFKNTYIGHSWGNMVALHDGKNNSFENCIIEDFGWVGVFTSGIHINEADNTNISKCTFGEAGRFQIRMDGGDAKVNILDSDFYGSMKMGEDAGPLEATSTGRIESLDLKGGLIAYNKVHDVKGLPVSDGGYSKQKIVAFYMEDTENYTAHHNLVYNFKSDNYKGAIPIERVGEFLYLGPRYNRMQEPVNYYNNTVWNYDKLLSIWNIEIDNWQELGLSEEDASGSMEDGHFANNIFMNNSSYKLSYVRQKLNATGGNLGYVTLNPSPSLETTDFKTYTDHCVNYGYHFNPENNVLLDFSNQHSNFMDAPNGDFRLKDGSTANKAGRVISGITSSATPDSGALEGGDRVLNAGADLEQPVFKEEVISIKSTKFTITSRSETCKDKKDGILKIVSNTIANFELLVNGTKYSFTNEKLLENLEPGTYDVCINIKDETENQCYQVEVVAAKELSSRTNIKNKQLEVSIDNGTAPFTVNINDTTILETLDPTFSMDVKHGDKVTITSNKACEGELVKMIDLYSEINVYPNPSMGEFKIHLPISEGNVAIEILDIRGQVISSNNYRINAGEVNLDLNEKASGMYFVRIGLDKPVNFKIVKK
jgi:hypothetical protein